MVSTLQALHYVVDQFIGVFLSFLGKMQIDHGGLQPGMSHVSLDDPEVDACLQKMGGIGVAFMPSSA
jgi:hypothetical protein